MKRLLYLLFTLSVCACNGLIKNKSNESVLEIIANTDYNKDGHRATWADHDWWVFSWKGDQVYSAGTVITPSGYDSIWRLICNEFGGPTYFAANYGTGMSSNITEELIASDTTRFDLCRWEDLDQIYYWCNDSLDVCWSLFLIDSFSLGWYSYLTIDQLTHPQHIAPLRDLVANSVYGETHAYSEWNNRHWEVFGKNGDENFEALTTSISTYTFDSIRGLICREYGAPTYNVQNFPEALIPKADTGTFWMTAKQHDQYYYWRNDSLIIGFSLAESYPTGIGYAYLSVKFLSARLAQLWSKGKYETYIDSLRATNPDDTDVWERKWFNNERHYKFANDIYYADSYEVYFGLLNEFLPLALPSNATEYDRYLNSKIQIDSLLSFPGYFGCTIDVFSYNNYENAYTRWNIQRFSNALKSSGMYSAEVDSAWLRYVKAMLVAVDTVIIGRPRCLGRMSYMEHRHFAGRLGSDQLASMLDALYANQRTEQHITIHDAEISAAYDTLKSHIKEHVSKKGLEDLDACHVPLSNRLIAIAEDEETWMAFIEKRNKFSRTLKGKRRQAYNNATNNLKRNKLWMLRNEYRCYAMAEYTFIELLLPFDCTDEELMQYNFQESYKAEYGNYPMFD